jgi:hypothetical protein
MRTICGHHARIADLETMEKDQHQYRAIQTDLDDMDKNMKRYRTLKIVQPKKGLKPVIRPRKDDKDNKHTTQPVR